MTLRTLAFFLTLIGSLPVLGKGDSSLCRGGDLRASSSFHPDDIMFGLGGGLRFRNPYRIGAEFFFRPDHRSMIYEKGTRKVQYREKRYSAMLYVERIFAPSGLAPLEAFLGLSGGRSWEARNGFPDRTLGHWTVIPKLGAGYRFGENFLLELEYRFAPHPALNAAEHRAALRSVFEL